MGLKISERYSNQIRPLKDVINTILGRPTNREIVETRVENVLGQVDEFIETVQDPLIKDLMRVKYQITLSSFEQLASELDVVNRFCEDDTATILARKIRMLIDELKRK